MSIGSGQLARHIGLPWRSAAGAAFNTNDMQATHETVMFLWGCLQTNATMVIHSAGWLEGGLTFGFEKFIQDIEALQSIAHLCKPVPSDASAIGLDAIAQVAPGGHFFATDQTMAQYSSVFAIAQCRFVKFQYVVQERRPHRRGTRHKKMATGDCGFRTPSRS